MSQDDESQNVLEDLEIQSGTTSRREATQRLATSSLAFLAGTSTLWNTNPSQSMAETASTETDTTSSALPKKTIMITGCNSGVGLEGAKLLHSQGHSLVLACRTISEAQQARDSILSNPASSQQQQDIIPVECDLSSLESIQACVNTLKDKNNVLFSLDTLCLNAGLARNTNAKDVARTKDGYEMTVGVNHFGHFYLTHLILETLLQQQSKLRRIVVTASSVHDPASPGGAQGVPAGLGELQGLIQMGRGCEMLDGNPFNADKAYKDSKLCNVLFTRELQRRLENNNKNNNDAISVNCFSPGLIVSTGLFRDQSPLFTKIFDVAATNLLKVAENVEWGGATLAYMATSNDIQPAGAFYSAPAGTSQKYGGLDNAIQEGVFTITEPSQEAKDNAKAALLWKLSEQTLGIQTCI